MISKTWKSKLKLDYRQDFQQDISVSNTFGLLFTKGDDKHWLYFIPLNATLELQSILEQTELLLCFDRELIEEDDVEYALDVLNVFNLTKNNKIPLHEEFAKELQQIIQILDRELQKPDGSYLIVKSTLKILLLNLIRYQQGHFLDQDLQQKRIYSFLQLMEQNFQQQTQAKFYAEKLGLSTKRLNQIITDKLGVTANHIIQQRRFTEIKRELQNNNSTLKEIAFKYNFNSDVSFSRFFKRQSGISPSEFRQQSSHNTTR